MDFSQAQRVAHAEEFVTTMTSRVAGWADLSHSAQVAERKAQAEDAGKYQQGCEVHFRRSAMRIRKDDGIIPPELTETFQVCIDTLLSPETSPSQFKDTIIRLHNDFPPILRSWIKWWENPRISQMVFPACRDQGSDFYDEIPHTSNPIETQHSSLHHATGKDKDLIQGIDALFRHAKRYETQYQAVEGASANCIYRLVVCYTHTCSCRRSLPSSWASISQLVFASGSILPERWTRSR